MNQGKNLKKIIVWAFCLLVIGILGSCDIYQEDVAPQKFENIRINADDIYLYPTKAIRLNHFVNDTLPAFENITYSAPLHGKIINDYDVGGVIGYQPEANFVGTDSIAYQVCAGQTCKTATIRLHVEEPLDTVNCTNILAADSLETTMNTPKEIRHFFNDIICPGSYEVLETRAPEKGTYRLYTYSEKINSYAGTLKNQVYVYTPPKNYRGTDSFVYRVYPQGGFNQQIYQEVKVKITIK